MRYLCVDVKECRCESHPKILANDYDSVLVPAQVLY